MITLKIKITKDILVRSSFCDGSKINENCAFAVALRDIFPDARVGYTTVFLSTSEAYFGISQDMTDFIREFDHSTPEERKTLPEQEFEVEIPDYILETINIDEVTETLKDHPVLTLTHQ